MTEEEMYKDIPEFIHQSIRNVEDLFCAMTDKGIKNLDTGANKMDKLMFTSLGIQLKMNNRDGSDFAVIVMPHADDNEVRRTIIRMAKGIRKTFPHLKKSA